MLTSKVQRDFFLFHALFLLTTSTYLKPQYEKRLWSMRAHVQMLTDIHLLKTSIALMIFTL